MTIPAPAALPLEGLSARLTAAIRAGHRFDYELGYDADRCGCEGCRRCDRLLLELRQPATREATEWLLARARSYYAGLWRLYEYACFSSGDDARAEAEPHARGCARLADDLGVPLSDQVRAMALRHFGDTHGTCPGCVIGTCHAEGER